MKRKKHVPFFFIFFAFSVFRFTSHALDFEDILPSGRIAGLGGSHAALANDYQSLWINPAGLTSIETEGISAGFGHYYSFPVAVYHFSYARPIFEGISSASGWQSSRSATKRFDRFLFSWAQTAKVPWLETTPHRFSWGMSLRALSLQTRDTIFQSFKSKLGAGVDSGILLELPASKSRLGASLTALDSANLNLSGPFLTLGMAQRFRNLNVALDFRARKGLSTFYPGIEADFFGNLLTLRAGRGIRLGAFPTVAFGFGFNLLPLTVDVGFHLPPQGLYQREGAAILSVSYAFGGPRFYQRFVGIAAQEAQTLSKEIDTMETKKRKSQAERTDIERDLRVLREEVRVLQNRIREEAAGQDIREAGTQRKEREEKELAKPKPPQEEWPKYRKVQAGDTLRSIAAQAYGDPNLWELIYKSNPEKILRGLPRAGGVLKIPKP